MTALNDKKLELIRLKKLLSKQLRSCYSADDMESEPTKDQQEFLDDINTFMIRWAVASNRAGKSAGGARECAWIFNDDHPFFSRPKEWGTGPITLAILGKKSSMMEEELWNKKIKPLLGPGNYKESRNSSGLQKVTNEDNGNIILFQSHNNPEEARKNIQGHTLNWIWIDEMPESHRLISELVMRITTNNGRLIGTFTPLIHNVNVKKIIDSAAAPIAKRYYFSIFDNPAIAPIIDKVIEAIKQNCATEAEFRCRVYGEWMSAGKSVSCYNPDKHFQKLPEHYDYEWRHVVGVDPSASGLTGLSVWGEDPLSGIWYNVKSKYLQGDAAYILVGLVEEEIAKYRIVLRVCDPNPAGFYKEASRRRITYHCVSEKAGRKHDLIDNSNKQLTQGKAKLTELSTVLEDELSSAAWNEATGKLVNASSYHTFDTFQYVMDNLPPWNPEVVVSREFNAQIKFEAAKEKEVRLKRDQQKSYRVYTKARRRNRFNSRVR